MQIIKSSSPIEKAKSDQAIEIASLKKRVDKLEKRRQLRTTGLKRFKKLDAEVTLVIETQEQQNEDLMFDTGVLDDDEVFVDVTTSEKDEQSTQLDDGTAGEVVTTANVKDSVAPTIQVSTADIGGVTAAMIHELTLAQTRIEIKAAKPKVVTTAATTTTTTRPKAKGVVVQEPRRCLEGKSRDRANNKNPKESKNEDDKMSDEVEEVSKDDEGELMKHLVIKKDEDIEIDAIPLVTQLPMIIDYKLHKESMMLHYQLIRAYGSSKRYFSMIRMLQGIDREDLDALWKIVKTKYVDIRPEDEFERVL
ncbi:hypothetical protein Tco_1458892 [Tanacetum coccineum]